MIVSFELTMPNNNSWNGKWTGADKKYFVIRKFAGKDAKDVINKVFISVITPTEICAKSFYYNFGDGWGANVKAEVVDSYTARKRTKESAGFCGYQWMIESIIKHGKIIA